MKSHMKDALEAIARRRVPEKNINLWPNISAQLGERKSLMQTLRTRPLLIILLGILILLLLTGVAYAIGNLMGYIPGVGFVNQSSPIRVLAKPASVTRDGITITVKEAVLSSDKTIILFAMENIPFDKLSSLQDMQCPQSAELRLPNGMILQGNVGGGSNGTGTGYKWRSTYASVPANVNNATLLIPCIVTAAPGVLPENWELPLRFVPAPPDMKVMPVIEITPSPAPTSGSGTAVQNPLSITKVIDAGDNYILIGEFQPPTPSYTGEWQSLGSIEKLSDANNQEVSYDFPQDVDLPSPSSPKTDVWSIKFNKGFAPPLRITYSNQYSFAASSRETVEFEFDAGPNPQEGQTWQLNKEIKLAGHSFTLISVTASGKSYNFDFVSPDMHIANVGIDIAGYNQGGGGGGGEDSGGSSDQLSKWSEELNYSELPKGKLSVILSNLWLNGESKDWTLDWQPPLH